MGDVNMIVDGIDVSTCKHYFNSTHLDYNCNETPRSTYCKNNPDCYFKQKCRAEAERDDWRNMLDNSEVRVALTDVRTGEREVWRKLGNKASKYEKVLKQIKDVVNDHINCDDVGHYIRDTDARHALEEVAEAMSYIEGLVSSVVDKK